MIVLAAHVIALVRTKQGSDKHLHDLLDRAVESSNRMSQVEQRLQEHSRSSHSIGVIECLHHVAIASDQELIQARKSLRQNERRRIRELARLWRDKRLTKIEGRKVLFSHYCRYKEWRNTKIYEDEVCWILKDYLASDPTDFRARQFVLHTPREGPSVLFAADDATDDDSHVLVLWAHLPVSDGNGNGSGRFSEVPPNCEVFSQVYARKIDPITVVPVTFLFAPGLGETNRDTYLIYEDRPENPELVENQHRNLHGFSHAVRVSYSKQALISVELALTINRDTWIAEPDESLENSDRRLDELVDYLGRQIRPTFKLIAPSVERVRRSSRRKTKNLDAFFESLIRRAGKQVYEDIMLFKREGACQITEQAGQF